MSKSSRVNDGLDTIGVGLYQLIVLFLAGGIYASEGCLLLIVGHVAKGLVIAWDLSALQIGTVVFSVFAGITLGTLVGGFCSDTYGRRLPILCTYFGLCVFLFFCWFSKGLLMLAIGKTLMGFFMGFALPAANTLVCESCPNQHRANIYCATMVCFAGGQMFAAAIMWTISEDLDHDELHWRMMFLIGMILPGVLGVLSFFLLEESPHWLLLNELEEKCKNTLLRMARCNGKYDKIKEMTDKWDGLSEETLETERGEGQDDGPTSPTRDAVRTAIQNSGEESPLLRRKDVQGETPARDCWGRIVHKVSGKCKVTCSYRVRSLFSRYYRRTTIIMTYTCFASNITYYGLIYGLPHTFKSVFKEDKGGLSAGAGIFFAALMEIPGVFLAILLSSTVSRKANMCFSFVMSALCLMVLIWAFYSGHVRTIGVWSIFGVKMFIASGFIVCYLYLLECYPTYFRATGLAFCMVTGRIGALICPFLYDGLVYSGAGYIWFFTVIGCIITVAAVLVCFLPFETKDAPLSDI
jgi:MFS family permease